MMTRRLASLLLAALAVLSVPGCSGRSGEGLSVSFDVESLPPPPPPPPEPAWVPPPPPPPPAPDPEALRRERLRSLNESLQPVYFLGDRWDVTAEAASAIAVNMRLLSKAGGFHAIVAGHTDSNGTADYRTWLGLWRAKSVKDALRDLGMDPARFTLQSRADSEPASTGSTEQEHALNRRVRIIVTALD
jgi:outer membrane protein OmpA-like peptidoglycan-associated protein